MKKYLLFQTRSSTALMIAGLAATGLMRAPAAAAESTELGSTADVDVVDIEIEQHWTTTP